MKARHVALAVACALALPTTVLAPSATAADPITVEAPTLVSITQAVNGWHPSRVTAVFAGVEPGPVECRLDAGAWTACVDGKLTTPVLTHGQHALRARMAYPELPAGPELVVPIRVDAARPSVTAAKAVTFTKSAAVAAKWTAKDSASGVGSYRVAVKRFAPGAKTVAWAYPKELDRLTKASTSIRVTRGETLCWMVSARDKAGNASPWSARRCTASLFDERGVTRSKGWAKKKSKKAFLGTYLQTKKNRASFTLPTTYASEVAVVVTMCPSCGTVDYYINGKLIDVIDTYSTKTRHGVVKTFRTKAKGKAVKVRIVAGTFGLVPVKIEGFGLQRY